jgi:hypothetical protein
MMHNDNKYSGTPRLCLLSRHTESRKLCIKKITSASSYWPEQRWELVVKNVGPTSSNYQHAEMPCRQNQLKKHNITRR